jgi:hypothetical protein
MKLDSKKAFEPFLQGGYGYVRQAEKQGCVDGAAEYPPPDARDVSDFERSTLQKAKTIWQDYRAQKLLERKRGVNAFKEMTEQIERDSSRSEQTIGARQKKALDLLEAEKGEDSSTFKSLKREYEEALNRQKEIETQLGRPLHISLRNVYIPLMVMLAIAEIPVNRLAFELFFESMPAVSLLLSAAVGALLIFFAHILGEQIKHSRCPVQSVGGPNSLGIGLIIFISLMLIYSLGVMREQLVNLEAASVINLENLTLEQLTADTESNAAFSFALGSKGVFLVILNIAIAFSGVLASFFRHDSHPFLEKATLRAQQTSKAFLSHQQSYERDQISILRQFNQEAELSEQQREQREQHIEAITKERNAIDNEIEELRAELKMELTRSIRAYRAENLATRSTPPPKYFEDTEEGIITGCLD